jgi:MFS family permease
MDRFGGSRVAEGFQLYTLLTWLVVLAEIPGGLIVDLFRKYKEGILYGGMLISMGYFILAFGNATTDILSLCLVLAGLGIYGPSHLTEFQRFYRGRHENLTSGMAYYIASIELAALLAGMSGSSLMVYLGWRQGFMICGILMILGHIYFILVSRPFREKLLSRKNTVVESHMTKILLALSIVALGTFIFLLNNQMSSLANWMSSASTQFSNPSILSFVASILTILFLILAAPYFSKTPSDDTRNIAQGILVFVIVFVLIAGGIKQVTINSEFLPAGATLLAGLGYALSYFLIVPSTYAFFLKRTKRFKAATIALLNMVCFAAFNLKSLISDQNLGASISNFSLVIGTVLLTLTAIYFLKTKRANPESD